MEVRHSLEDLCNANLELLRVNIIETQGSINDYCLYPRYSEKWNYYGPGSISFRRARSTARSSPESA